MTRKNSVLALAVLMGLSIANHSWGMKPGEGTAEEPVVTQLRDDLANLPLFWHGVWDKGEFSTESVAAIQALKAVVLTLGPDKKVRLVSSGWKPTLQQEQIEYHGKKGGGSGATLFTLGLRKVYDVDAQQRTPHIANQYGLQQHAKLTLPAIGDSGVFEVSFLAEPNLYFKPSRDRRHTTIDSDHSKTGEGAAIAWTTERTQTSEKGCRLWSHPTVAFVGENTLAAAGIATLFPPPISYPPSCRRVVTSEIQLAGTLYAERLHQNHHRQGTRNLNEVVYQFRKKLRLTR